jgi:hypothetical protein
VKRVVPWLLVLLGCAGAVSFLLAVSPGTHATKPPSMARSEVAPIHVVEPTKVAPRIVGTIPAASRTVPAETPDPPAPQATGSFLPESRVRPTSDVRMLVVIGDSTSLSVARGDIKTYSRRLYNDLAGRRLKLQSVGGQRFRIQTVTALPQVEAARLCDTIKRRGLSCVLAYG